MSFEDDRPVRGHFAQPRFWFDVLHDPSSGAESLPLAWNCADPRNRFSSIEPFYTSPRVRGKKSASSQTLKRLLAATRPTLSLDAPSRSDGVTAVVDFLIPSEDDESQTDDSDESVGVLIEKLDPREQLVLTLRFGLKGSEQQTLVQVSKVLGVSKERVRQIEARALRKLRERPNCGLRPQSSTKS